MAKQLMIAYQKTLLVTPTARVCTLPLLQRKSFLSIVSLDHYCQEISLEGNVPSSLFPGARSQVPAFPESIPPERSLLGTFPWH